MTVGLYLTCTKSDVIHKEGFASGCVCFIIGSICKKDDADNRKYI